MANKTKKKEWEERDAAQAKAEKATDKFIEAIKKLKTWDSWEKIFLKAVVQSGDTRPKDLYDEIEYIFDCHILHGDSIPEQYKIEEFREQLRQNPYQLNLI